MGYTVPGGLQRIASWLVVLALVTAGSSCSTTPKGALMLAITTDMQTPKDLSVVSVYVTTNGAPKFDYLGRVLPDGTVALPATLAIVQPDDPNAQIRIRVIGFQEQKARVLRDVLTTIPAQRTALLRLPLDLIDDGSAIGTLPSQYLPLGSHSTGQSLTMTLIVPLDNPPGGTTTWNPLTIMSSCPTGQTSVNGQCVSEDIDSSSLPTFEPTAVFGDAGVQSNGAPVECFDVSTCFAGATPVTNVDSGTCSFSLGGGSEDAGPPSPSSVTNLALVTAGTGTCLSQGECFVPLENDPQQGWSASGGVVTMVPGICNVLQTSGATLYAVNGGCAPLTEAVPVCEPFDFPSDGGVVMGDDASAGDASPVDARFADGTPTDGACVPATCKGLGYDCGPSADGCGGTIDCGSCAAPQICGGGGTPFVCGPPCTGLCQQQVSCPGDGGTTTTLTGQVAAASAPGGGTPDPVPNVTVFVPTGTLPTLTTGAQCTQCVSAGTALVSTTTNAAGQFVLTNVPAGANIPIVIQLGLWRKQISVPAVAACTANSAGTISMPTNQTQGNIPHVAIYTGATEAPECVLRGMGIDDSEFTSESGTGRIHLYSSASDNAGMEGPGAAADANSTGEAALMSALSNYDIVGFGCWGVEATKPANELAELFQYAQSGGRVLATHYNYDWLYQNGAWNAVANWDQNFDVNETSPLVATIQTSTPETALFEQWANNVGAATGSQISIASEKDDVDAVIAPTESWITGTDAMGSKLQTLLFTFDTPVGQPAAQQCGRVAFADFHNGPTIVATGMTYPAECQSMPLTPEEKVTEYMFWNLSGSTCITPPAAPTCTKLTCAAQGIECGAAGDGCGNTLPSCGSCTAPKTCGGGGFGKCG